MKRWVTSVLVAACVHASAGHAQPVLYGTTTEPEQDSSLYTLDAGTGAATLVGVITGFGNCSALEASVEGVLYAVCQRASDAARVLITIDPATAAGTEIGALGAQAQVTDIAFAPDGTLFGYLRLQNPLLLTIDTATGAASSVGGTIADSGNGISFVAATLFHAGSSDLSTLDPSSGSPSLSCVLGLEPESSQRINAMDTHPVSGVLFASVADGEGNPDGFLATVDRPPVEGVCPVTALGDSVDGLDAIAFLVPPDLAITKSDAPDPVVAGSQLTYTITIENLGLADAPNVVVTDTLPAGTSLVSSTGCVESPGGGAPTCTIASVPASGSAVVTLVVSVSPAAIGPLVNVATIAPSQANQDPANDSATTSTAVTALGPAIPALSEWALGALALVLLATGLLFVRRM
jgi:uncharacterized repeat protein (TIGR01451 family)